MKRSILWRILGAVVLLASACGSTPSAALTTTTTPSTECKWSAGATDWKNLQATPTEFGVDTIHVAGDSPIKLDSVDLKNPSGIKLTGVMFIRGGGYGEGGKYGDASLAPSAKVWAARINMPGAVLPVSTSSSGEDDWQAVVGLIPTAATGGTADGVQLSYHVGDTAFVLEGVMKVAVTLSESGCPAT